MKNLKQHINEALKINSKSKVIKHQRPKNKKELVEIINERIKNLDSIVLDLTDINTDLIIDMSYLFERFSYELYPFKIIDVTGWDVSNVEDMTNIFSNLVSIEEIKGLHTWNMKNVKNASGMFQDCEMLRELDLSKWEMPKVEKLYNCFENCKIISKINVSGWNCQNLLNINSMFYGCTELEEIIGLNEIGDVSKCDSFIFMFCGCEWLKKIDISKWDISSCDDTSHMFEMCFKLEEVNMPPLIGDISTDYMFLDCRQLQKIQNIESWNLKTFYTDIFSNCFKLPEPSWF